MWLLVYFEGKSVLSMLSNFISAPYSSRRKQNCSLPACLPFILQHIWQHSQGWDCGSRNLTLGSESTGKAAHWQADPYLQSQASADWWHIWSSLELAQMPVDEEERGKVRRKVEKNASCTFHFLFHLLVCCCCELLNSCSALSQKGLWVSGGGE